MSFEFSDRHIVGYHTQGYTIFQDMVPAPLMADLRREADRGRPIARQLQGGNAQRLQPFQPHLDPRPFQELWNLPSLHKALRELFGHEARAMDGLEVDGDAILYEPGDSPYCMCWHRDFRDLWPGMDLEKWQAALHNPRMFNQSNVALYDDGALWVVPGSHLRRDTPEEIRRFPIRPIPSPDLGGLSPEEAEYACRDYARSMPGAVQVWLNAGDFMIYRNTLWHLGNYVPYAKRATVHGSLVTPEYREFIIQEFLPAVQSGAGPEKFTNLNTHTPAYREAAPRAKAERLWRRLGSLPRRAARRLLGPGRPAAGR